MLKFHFKILTTEKEVKLNYKHLTMEERYHIQAYKKAGFKQQEIAKELKVSPATISRELARNSSSQRKIYSAKSADDISVSRRRYASMKSNLKMDSESKKLIKKYIEEDWSPEQVSKRLKVDDKLDISYVRIYQFIEQDKQKGGELYTHLRFHHTGHRRAKYGAKYQGGIKDRISISQRSDIVEDKTRIGDWEIDTIIGTNKKGAITTCVDRVTLLSRISIPTTKQALEVEQEIIRILLPIKDTIKTITTDNGFEFSNHKNISKSLDCDYYFCHPYSSWERGLNEYTNGLIRQYIPKGTSFENITAEYIKMIEDKLNNRPRKTLNWKTPNEVFYGIKMAA
jgi:IS30 family transposase